MKMLFVVLWLWSVDERGFIRPGTWLGFGGPIIGGLSLTGTSCHCKALPRDQGNLFNCRIQALQC